MRDTIINSLDHMFGDEERITFDTISSQSKSD